ncbi:MAG: pyridoxal phosphate-dependent aminotransferase [Planctomycetia bacterium]|nr:pyridoxal phosphate-dependent aminotransferase [Planctomycetia bacterium]
MRFNTIKYMEWAKLNQHIHPVSFDLSNSAMAPPTPEEIGVTAEDAHWEGENHYGHPVLKELIAKRYGVKEEMIIPSGGSSLANFLFAAALLDTGDKAAIEVPYYEPLGKILEALEAKVIEVPRRREEKFQPDVDAATKAFEKGAKLLILTDLYNPAAVHLDRARLKAIGESAAKHGAKVLVDEVYLDAMWDKRPPIAATLGPQFLSTNSLTKVYGLGNLRAGWGIGPKDLVDRAYRVYDYLSVLNSMPTDNVAIRCHRNLDKLAARSRKRRDEHFPILKKWVASRKDVEWIEPEWGFIAWLRLTSRATSDRLEPVLRKKYDAQVAPGHYFGCPDHIRVGIGLAKEKLEEGLKRLGKALDEFAGA